MRRREVGTWKHAQFIIMVIKTGTVTEHFKNKNQKLLVSLRHCNKQIWWLWTICCHDNDCIKFFKSENHSWANGADKVIMNTDWIKSGVWISVSRVTNIYCALHWIYPSSLLNFLTEISPLVHSWLLRALRGKLTHTNTHRLAVN